MRYAVGDQRLELRPRSSPGEKQLGKSMREWEQGHGQPEAPTRVLLVASRPEVVDEVLQAAAA